MKLEYTLDKKAIQVELADKEVLGNLIGPTTATIPVAEGNKEYDEIVKKKHQIKEPPAPGQVVPTGVTPLQARKAIRAAGLSDRFKTEMSKASYQVQEEWEYATVIERKNPLITEFTKKLGMTDKQIDDLFIFASTL